VKRSLLLVAAVVIAGCGVKDTAAGWFEPKAKQIEVIELRRALTCNTPDENVHTALFEGLAAVRDWEKARGVELAGADPLPDGPYAIVELGKRNTGGYAVAVSRQAKLTGKTLRLSTTFIAPGQGRLVSQMITSPCVLVSLPAATYKTLEVVDETGAVRATATAP
jgi:hypothetical protein